ncbi:MAG: rRNA pseudouridine synthase [Candidatus Sabulitectum sp.]|nr:rRNA pseudouridine synthase [Candidatus Sabulitectum sp.]
MTRSSKGGKTASADADGMRLNRYIARSGVASRRNCDAGIRNGMVTVNGRLITNPAEKISEGDLVLWDAASVTLPDMFVAVMNKPSGYETTMNENASRPVSQLAIGMPRGAAPAGRLDIRTGGLLLWSNDGELVYRLTHPKWRIEREYSLILARSPEREAVEKMRKGVYIAPGEFSKPKSVEKTGSKTLSVVLTTGRNREVRRLSKFSGIPLIGLERIRFGPIQLEDLERGKWRILNSEEIALLCKAVRLDR